MSVSELILNYRDFLIASWPYLSTVHRQIDWDSDPYFTEDWEQANWELLVEIPFGDGCRLVPYGFSPSPESRFSNRGTEATHRITCRLLGEVPETDYQFLCFTTPSNGEGFEISPPFDFVNLENIATRERLVLPLSDLTLEIDKLK